MYRNILFDLDGTLTDPMIGITNSIIHSLQYFPAVSVPPREELIPFIGPPLPDSYQKYFGMSQEDSLRALGYFREYFAPKGIFENRVYDGIPELLRALCVAGRRCVLATSKPQAFAERILEHFGLSAYFTDVQGSTMDGSRVKKTDIITYTLSVHPEFSLAETVMVGDRSYDIVGAAANGLASIGVSYGYGTTEELQTAGASTVAESVAALQAMLLS